MILVTGATGTTGSRVLALLRAQDLDAVGASRQPREGWRRLDWSDPQTWAAALEDVDAVYLVPPTRDADPTQVLPAFLELAHEKGVRRVVLLSSSMVAAGGPATGGAHALLPQLFAEWAVLRPSWFMQNVTGPHHLAREIRGHGTITTAAADGRIAFVDADDIAAVGAVALTVEPALNTDLVLTGPEALTYDDVATLVGDALGTPVVHVRGEMDEVRQHLEAEVPPMTAAVLAYVDTLLASGVEDRTTDVVERVTGRPPRSYAAFVAATDLTAQTATGT